MNLNDRNIFVTKSRGRTGYRGNSRRNSNKVKPIQMGTLSKQAQVKYPAKSHGRASATISSSNIDWKTPVSNKNNYSSTLYTSTHSSKSEVTDDESRIVVALSEGRGDATNEVGIAAINIIESNIILCQIPDLQSYVHTITKLNILKPVEILIPMTCVNANRLTEIIKSKFPNVKITAVSRTWYNNTSGFQNLSDLCASHWKSTLLTVKHKFYALVAFNALINYLLMELNISYGKESLKIDFQVPDGHAIIDASTADNLELVTTRRAIYQRYSSLMGVLNHCKTKVGARLLRATILQPPSEVDEINSRLDCVQELMDNPGLLTEIQHSLFKLSSIHQLLSLSILTSTAPSTTTTETVNNNVPASSPPNASQRYLNYLLTLNGFLQQSVHLHDALGDCHHEYLSTLRALLEMPVIDDLRQLIGTLMCDDAVKMSGQQGGVGRVGLEYCAFVIKPGVCALLDVVRTGYTDKIAAMREYVKSLSSKYSLPLTLSNTTKKGYHIVMQINKNQRLDFKKSSLPKECIQVDRLLGSVTMKTADLINSSDRTEDMLSEIIKLSNIILSKTLVEIRKHCDIFYLVCEYVAKVDMMQSLAEASSVGQSVRPRFGTYTQVIESRHPLLCYLRPQEPVPNDIHISPWYNLNVITGANGSGKSIYIRQVILLQVMAQVGCFVPARRAIFRVADRILARVSLNDDMENSASAFVLEMREIDYFLTVLTDNTLIVIDELGRSTSLETGTAIAFAICKKLLSTKAFTFITTHFGLLPKIQNMYLNAKNWYMETLETNKLIDNKYKTFNFTYLLKPGVVSLKRYGIYFARICWPKEAIKEVERVMMEDEARWEENLPAVESVHPLIRLKYDCEADLQLLPRKTAEIIKERLLIYRQDCQIFFKKLNIEENKLEISICNDTTPNEEILPILEPIVTLGDTTNKSSTLQDESTLTNQLEEFEDSSDSFKLIQSSKIREKCSNDLEKGETYFSNTKGSTNYTSSSLNWGVNKQYSNSNISDSSIDSINESSKISRQLSDGTISSQLFQADQEYRDNLEKSCRSETNQADNIYSSKGTTSNTSNSLNWGFNVQNSKTISHQVTQTNILAESKVDENILTNTSNWNPTKEGSKNLLFHLDCKRNSASEQLNQTNSNSIDMESIRSEVESYREELFSAWDEDENEKGASLDPQTIQNVESIVQLDDAVSNNNLQEFLFEKQMKIHKVYENDIEHSGYNNNSKPAGHELVTNDIVDLDCEEEESISYSPRMNVYNSQQNEQLDKSNVDHENESEKNQGDIHMDLKTYSQNGILEEQPQTYSQILENSIHSASNILNTQTIAPYLQNTQELDGYNAAYMNEPANIFQNELFENYSDDYEVISNASQMTNSYADSSQFTGFNFAAKTTKTSSIVDIHNEDPEKHILFSESTEVASNVNTSGMASTRKDEDVLISPEVLKETDIYEECVVSITSANDDAVLQMQTSNEDPEIGVSDSDYHNFVHDFQTIIQESQCNSNLNEEMAFHDADNSNIVLESSQNTVAKNISTDAQTSSSPDHQFIARSHDIAFKTASTHAKSSVIYPNKISSRSSKSNIMTPNAVGINSKTRKPRFVPPLKKVQDISEEHVATPSTSQTQIQTKLKKVTRKRNLYDTMTSFKSPKQLTRKDIEADFFEQDMKLLESGEQLDKNMFLNRPSVKQLQQMTCVVQFDDNRRPIFNTNAYCKSNTSKQNAKQSKKFAPPLKHGDSEKSMTMFTNFQNSLKRDSTNTSGSNDRGYMFSMNARPNINLFASGDKRCSNVASTTASNYYENISSNAEQMEYSKNISSDLDDIMFKYL